MNHASYAAAPPGTEVVQAGNAIWRRAKRRAWPGRSAVEDGQVGFGDAAGARTRKDCRC
jgi:hypothetical protein